MSWSSTLLGSLLEGKELVYRDISQVQYKIKKSQVKKDFSWKCEFITSLSGSFVSKRYMRVVSGKKSFAIPPEGKRWGPTVSRTSVALYSGQNKNCMTVLVLAFAVRVGSWRCGPSCSIWSENGEIIDVYMSNLQKVRMDYSSHAIYIYVIMLVLVGFHCSGLRISPGQVQNYQTFGSSLVSVKRIEKVINTQEQVQKYCNWRKESSLRL